MNEMATQDPAALLAYADACYEQLDKNYVKFVEVIYMIHETQAYKPEYETFPDYVEKRFSRRLRSTQEYLKLGRAYKQAPALKELSYSKARLLAGHIAKGDFNELVDMARNTTVAELQTKLAGKINRPLYRIAIAFTDEEEAATVRECVELGKKVVGSDSLHLVLVAMCREVRGTWEMMMTAHDELDPVTRAVLERDDWQCQGCGSRQNLQRHSHLKAHSCAASGDCVTLCAECHRLFHANKAIIESLDNEKFRYIRKY